MLCDIQSKKLCRHLLVGGALFAAGLGMYSCSDTYDLDTEQPSGLNSIYGYMKDQGNFTNYLRLIDDLGQKEILSKTGSKTMFIANDDAFARFYASNRWGVKNYESLSLAQKKLLLNSAMIDNPYSTSMLSTAEGPVKGEVCRRSSSLTLYDSVLVVPSKSAEADAILPHNPRFDEIRANRDTIVLYTDASNAAPMLHFNYKFVASNKFDNTDIDFLYNDPEGTRTNDDVYVNNSKVIDANIFCKNGFIHQVDEVIMPLDNMAEIIRKDPETKIFSSIIERFAVPDYSEKLSDAYKLNKGSEVDSIFNKRYFSKRSAESTREKDVAYEVDRNGSVFDAALKYDPGWNAYLPLSGEPRDIMMEDMAVMLVPTDSAFNVWWNGEGASVQQFYGTIDAVPNPTIAPLVNVNQLQSLIAAVPSRFQDVLDDANEPLRITKDDVKEVILGCNGLVYKTKKVFAPTSYKSVLFPAVVDTARFRVIKNVIDVLDYDKYLNSTVSKYIFLLPTNGALLSYVDPVSYGQTVSNLWEFSLDPSKVASKRLIADVYECTLNGTTGKWEKGEHLTKLENMELVSMVNDKTTVIQNRIQNLLDNSIIVEPYVPGKKYYKTKANTYVRIDGITQGSKVYGGFQTERDYPANVVDIPSNMANGTTIVVDAPVMGTRKSVAEVLSEHEEFSEFLEILRHCGVLETQNTKDKWAAASMSSDFGNIFNLKTFGEVGAEDKPAGSSSKDKATYLLNNYHYTFYAPTNAAMKKAHDMGLPTMEDVYRAEEADSALLEENPNAVPDSAARVLETMLDFVKYHIQDNSIYMDAGFENGLYESAKTELIPSTTIAESGSYTVINKDSIEVSGVRYAVKKIDETDGSAQYYTGKFSPGRPFKIDVKVSADRMTVTDNIGQTRDVVKELSNLQAQEYWIASGPQGSSTIMSTVSQPYKFFLNNSSSVVIQGIDTPLIYADGEHRNADNDIVPTQFKYKYKPLSSEARKRK